MSALGPAVPALVMVQDQPRRAFEAVDSGQDPGADHRMLANHF